MQHVYAQSLLFADDIGTWDHESVVSYHWHLDLFCDMSCELSYWAPLSYFVGIVFKSWS
jgi:hypothetical protein